MGAPASHVARQWKYAYDVGKLVFPSTALISSLLYSYVAYAVRGERSGRFLSGLYSSAAALNLLIAPFTVFAILPVNNVIWAYADRTDDIPVEGETLTAEENLQRERDEHKLVSSMKKLSTLNIIRGIFPLLGAGLGAAVSFGLI